MPSKRTVVIFLILGLLSNMVFAIMINTVYRMSGDILLARFDIRFASFVHTLIFTGIVIAAAIYVNMYNSDDEKKRQDSSKDFDNRRRSKMPSKRTVVICLILAMLGNTIIGIMIHTVYRMSGDIRLASFVYNLIITWMVIAAAIYGVYKPDDGKNDRVFSEDLNVNRKL